MIAKIKSTILPSSVQSPIGQKTVKCDSHSLSKKVCCHLKLKVPVATDGVEMARREVGASAFTSLRPQI